MYFYFSRAQNHLNSDKCEDIRRKCGRKLEFSMVNKSFPSLLTVSCHQWNHGMILIKKVKGTIYSQKHISYLWTIFITNFTFASVELSTLEIYSNIPPKQIPKV
jgi:hypothetical protein